MALICHAFISLEKFYLLSIGKASKISNDTRASIIEDFQGVNFNTPWEVRKDRVVIGLNRYFAEKSMPPISGRLFQPIPRYLNGYIESGFDMNAPEGPALNTELRFFVYNASLESSSNSSLVKDNLSMRLKFSVPDLGNWQSDLSGLDFGNFEDAIFTDLAECLTNVKFIRTNPKSWFAVLSFAKK